MGLQPSVLRLREGPLPALCRDKGAYDCLFYDYVMGRWSIGSVVIKALPDCSCTGDIVSISLCCHHRPAGNDCSLLRDQESSTEACVPTGMATVEVCRIAIVN